MRYTHEELLHIQEQLEQESHAMGKERYFRDLSKNQAGGREDESSYSQTFLRRGIQALAERITQETERHEAGRQPAHLPYLRMCLCHKSVAYLTLKAILSGVTSLERPLLKVALQIGSLVEDEAMMSQYKENHEEAYKHLMNAANKKDEYRKKRDAIMHLNRAVYAEHEAWPKERKVQVGHALIHMAMESLPGNFELSTEYKGGKTHAVRYLRPSVRFLRFIRKNTEALAESMYVPLPMVVKPEPWVMGQFTGGGYLFPGTHALTFMKTTDQVAINALKSADYREAVAALNATQETAWRIRKPVMALLMDMAERGNDLGAWMPLREKPVPIRPVWLDEHVAQRKAYRTAMKSFQAGQGTKPRLTAEFVSREGVFLEWKATSEGIHKENAQVNAKVSYVMKLLHTCKRFSEYEAIWFPYQLDFRGRVYAVTSINPQGEDWMKGILEFSEGKALGKDGVKWLKIHTANLFGVDKVTFDERVAWVDAHKDQLLACARGPWDCDFWTTADKPFQAYAACLELLGVEEEGEAYISRMPIALDGSCSGLQNLGMALRCEVTGASVNLLPCEKPGDIYRDVANKVQAAMGTLVDEADKAMAEQWAQWLEANYGSREFNRNITKRSVMTMPYGSKEYGFKEQLMEDFLVSAKRQADDKLRDGLINEAEYKRLWPFEGDGFQAAAWLAAHIYRGVKATVIKAAEAMEWLQYHARLLSKTGKAIHWTTPLGLTVTQRYLQMKEQRVRTRIAGECYMATLRTETPKLNTTRQANGISPNVVHSLDSSHLMMTVLMASQEGINAFALIHDSFGTHAGDTERFFQVIREAFLSLYEDNDIFQNLYEEWLQQLWEVDEEGNLTKEAASLVEQMRQPPAKGNLDLSRVLDSLYAFA